MAAGRSRAESGGSTFSELLKESNMPEREHPTSRHLLCCLATALLVAVSASAYAGEAAAASARPNHFQSAKGSVVYVPTRATVVDPSTHALRKLTAAEVDAVMVTLKPLASTPHPRAEAKTNGAHSLVLGDNVGTVVLARPNADGTFETRCVTRFEEAVQFLGLKAVAADSSTAKKFFNDGRN